MGDFESEEDVGGRSEWEGGLPDFGGAIVCGHGVGDACGAPTREVRGVFDLVSEVGAICRPGVGVSPIRGG